MISLLIQIALICLFYLLIGGAVGFILRRHIVLTVVLAPLIALFIPCAIDYVKAGFPLRTTLLQETVAGLLYAAGPLLVFVCLPALGGALLVVLRYRFVSSRGKKDLGDSGPDHVDKKTI